MRHNAGELPVHLHGRNSGLVFLWRCVLLPRPVTHHGQLARQGVIVIACRSYHASVGVPGARRPGGEPPPTLPGFGSSIASFPAPSLRDCCCSPSSAPAENTSMQSPPLTATRGPATVGQSPDTHECDWPKATFPLSPLDLSHPQRFARDRARSTACSSCGRSYGDVSLRPHSSCRVTPTHIALSVSLFWLSFGGTTWAHLTSTLPFLWSGLCLPVALGRMYVLSS